MARLSYVIGVDEAGRGPLAGPAAVAAVCWTLGVQHLMSGKFGKTRDSKRLSVKQREELFARIRECKKQGELDYAVSLVGERVIDREGIMAAVKIGIRRCLARLGCPPDQCRILLDGSLKAPSAYRCQKTIIRGDETVPIIALASVVAKVIRDRYMIRASRRYPGYGFERHKGYGTKAHYRRLKKLGPAPLHRHTFLD